MAVEDHPLSYGDFEGVIPEGNYGAGTVIVWDTGTYEPLGEGRIEDALDAGRASFWLEGSKLRGGYSLVRTGGGKKWPLIKRRGEAADARRNP